VCGRRAIDREACARQRFQRGAQRQIPNLHLRRPLPARSKFSPPRPRRTPNSLEVSYARCSGPAITPVPRLSGIAMISRTCAPNATIRRARGCEIYSDVAPRWPDRYVEFTSLNVDKYERQ
jgi:hypothetical protein